MRPARWISGCVFTAALALYAFSLGVTSDGQLLGNDAMPYASQLVRGAPIGLWNAHHLLFHPLAAAIAHARALFGAPFDEITVLEAQRLLSAIGGAAAVAVLFGFAARRAGTPAGLAVAALFATSYGHWLLSSVGETYTPASALVCLLLVRAAEVRLGERSESLTGLGLVFLAALLFRQDSVLVVLALPFLLSPRAALAVIAFGGLMSLGLYALAWAASGIEQPFVAWLLGLAHDGPWGTTPRGSDLGLAAGLTATAVHYGFVPLRRALAGQLDALASPALLSAFAALAAGLVALFPVPRFPAERARVVVGLGLFALGRFLFFAWWEPSNVEHHTGTLVPLFLLLPLLLPPAPGARRVAALAAAALLVLGGNLAIAILPNRVDATSRHVREAARLAGHGGLVVGLNTFAGHALLREPPRQARLFDASPIVVGGDHEQLPALRREVEAALARGATVVLVRAHGIWDRLLLKEPPIDLELVETLYEGADLRGIEDETGEYWAVVLEARE